MNEKKVKPLTECDHIIGYDGECYNADIIKVHEHIKPQFRFKYCPMCYTKLDFRKLWKKIKV